MKHNILVTITTIHGSKQYTITQLIKRFIYIFISLVIVAIIFLFFFIKYLNNVIEQKNQALAKFNQETKILINQKEALNRKIYVLKNNIAQLNETIHKKEKLLSEVNDKIEDIERIIKLEPPKDANIDERVDLAKLDLLDKRFILQNIPNGYPIKFLGITSKFGWRTHPILHKKEFHPGIDLRAKRNTPVVATADGIVEYAGYHKRSGYGNLLIIDHNFGFKTLFGHLKKIVVKNGQFVKKGDIIAYTGNTGLSNGPHLHYEVRYLSMVLNPYNFMKWNLKNYNSIFLKEKRIKWKSLIKAIKWQKQIIQQQ